MTNSNIDGVIENAEQQMESQAGDNDSGDRGMEDLPPTSSKGPGMTDDELMAVIESRETSITVIGCGGGGCNTIDRMREEGIHGADLIAMNTDVQHLTQIQADEKYLLGKQHTGGKGTGSVPQIGERAALADEMYIEDAVTGSDMVFVTAGLGGGTGTGMSPVVAKNAKQTGALTIAVVTMPFAAEGGIRRRNAEAGLERLSDIADTVIVIPNDRLLDSAADLPIRQAFKVADETLMRAVKGITELITRSRMVNLDFSDIETVMQSGGLAMIGFGESSSERKSRDAVHSAVHSPLLDVDISGANAALVNVTGGTGMSIAEAEGVVEELYEKVDPNARIIWGTGVEDSLGETIRTMVVVTGISSPQIYGQNEEEPEEPEIDYIE